MSENMNIIHIAALGVMLQVAVTLLLNKRQRELLQTTAPVTCFLLVAHGAAAAAVSAGVVQVEELALVDDLELAQPWRLLSCLLVYQRALPLAGHLWLLVKVGPQVEPRLGSRTYAHLLAFGAAASLVLRYALLPPPQRPPLLAAAPLLTVCLAWAKAHEGKEATLPSLPPLLSHLAHLKDPTGLLTSLSGLIKKSDDSAGLLTRAAATKPFNQHAMIMAHDAATTYLRGGWLHPVNSWAKTQADGGFAALLSCGARVSDMRYTWPGARSSP